MSLWLVTTLLLLGAALFVALPFYSARHRKQNDHGSSIAEQANIDVFRDQQLQYQQQLDRGEINAEQQAQMLAEAEQLLLNNTAATQQHAALNGKAQGIWLLPVLSQCMQR